MLLFSDKKRQHVPFSSSFVDEHGEGLRFVDVGYMEVGVDVGDGAG